MTGLLRSFFLVFNPMLTDDKIGSYSLPRLLSEVSVSMTIISIIRNAPAN